MSRPVKVNQFSEEDYLADEELSEVHHEYLDGLVYAMSGANERHNRITMNLGFHLRGPARGGPCGVFVSDMKLRVEANRAYYYPDVMVACDSDDKHELYKTRPCLVAEVLSPSTEAIDRREKLRAYQSIADLRYILLIASSHTEVDYFCRNHQGEWEAARLDEGEILWAECGAYRAGLGLEDIYEDVDFG